MRLYAMKPLSPVTIYGYSSSRLCTNCPSRARVWIPVVTALDKGVYPNASALYSRVEVFLICLLNMTVKVLSCSYKTAKICIVYC